MTATMALLALGGTATAANAAAGDPPVVKQVDASIETVTTTSLRPTSEALDQAKTVVDQKRQADPALFTRKTAMILASPATTAYLKKFDYASLTDQSDILAASMPTEALQGFTQMLDTKAIEMAVVRTDDGYTTVMTVHKASGVGPQDRGNLPQCPPAWAAFWAWFATNAAVCGPMAAMPVAAFACAAGFAVGGTIIDFNEGC
ncbi:hypothetical protein [Arthrobacter woluwensis]|uniref:hypothetical protein n=1 Tax=Arthrobacter woluwensis TaxID=156980 RepID=UPI0027D8E0DC|nr:hypothetical protein [Arthrobacter woluwensis]